MEILTDGALRDLLKQEGIRVTSDLTTRQRNEIQFYHQQGKLAYFKNGKLRVEDRRPHPSGDRRPHPSQRSQQEHRGYHDDHEFRDHEDWPLPHRPDRETSEVWNQRSHRKWKDDRNQTRRREDDSRYKYHGQQRDRNASDRNGPSNQPRHYDQGRHHQQRDGWDDQRSNQEVENSSRRRQDPHPEPHHDHRPDRNRKMDYGIPRTDHVNLGEGYNEWSYDSWGRPVDEQQTELLYSGDESRHTHRNSQSATVICQAWGVHRGPTGGRVRSREGDQSNPGNIVPGSRPYSKVVKSRTAPVTTGQTDKAVGRSTDGESAEEGTEGQPDLDSLIENNAASDHSAFDAGAMQNNADSNADHPLTSNDAVPGDALSINATPRYCVQQHHSCSGRQ